MRKLDMKKHLLIIISARAMAAPAWGATRYIDPDCANNGDENWVDSRGE
jgi:hypothetical protein